MLITDVDHENEGERYLAGKIALSFCNCATIIAIIVACHDTLPSEESSQQR